MELHILREREVQANVQKAKGTGEAAVWTPTVEAMLLGATELCGVAAFEMYVVCGMCSHSPALHRAKETYLNVVFSMTHLTDPCAAV